MPEGYYQVRLKFAEIADSAAGERIFNVLINNNTVLANFDVFAAANGKNLAVDKVFDHIVPYGGNIVIQFEGTGSHDPNPKIAAVEIVSELYEYPTSLSETGQFLAQIATVGSQPYATIAAPPMDFRIDANHMDAMSMAGVLLINFASPDNSGSATMNGNVVRLPETPPFGAFSYLYCATLIAELAVATVTGNQLLNATSERGLGLLMFNTQQYPGATVTGNVLQGYCELPTRRLPASVPAPMNTWQFMNTML